MSSKEISGIFEGPVVPIALKIAMPIMVANLVNLLYIITDTYFISLIDKSSTALLSGTGLIFPLQFLFMAIANSISAGVAAVTGRVVGEKNETTAEMISPSAFFIAVVIGVPAVVCGYLFRQKLLDLLAGTEITREAVLYGLQYFTYLLPGLVFMVFGYVVIGILMGEGKTNVIGKAMMFSVVLNIILDPVFIFLMGMGVKGAALATTLSTIIAVVAVTALIFNGKTATPISFAILRFRLFIIKEITRIGLPQLFNMLTVALSIIFLNKLVGNLGESLMNSWIIVGRMDQVLFIPSMGIGAATVSLLSQNFGRNNLERVRLIYRSNVVLVMVLIAIVATVYILVAPFLVPFFTSVAEVAAAAIFQVRITAYSALGMGVMVASVSAFQSTGKAYPTIVLPVFRLVVVTIPLAYGLVYLLDMKMMGVYLGLIIGNFSAIPVAYLWTRRRLNRLTFKAIGS